MLIIILIEISLTNYMSIISLTKIYKIQMQFFLKLDQL